MVGKMDGRQKRKQDAARQHEGIGGTIRWEARWRETRWREKDPEDQINAWWETKWWGTKTLYLPASRDSTQELSVVGDAGMMGESMMGQKNGRRAEGKQGEGIMGDNTKEDKTMGAKMKGDKMEGEKLKRDKMKGWSGQSQRLKPHIVAVGSKNNNKNKKISNNNNSRNSNKSKNNSNSNKSYHHQHQCQETAAYLSSPPSQVCRLLVIDIHWPYWYHLVPLLDSQQHIQWFLARCDDLWRRSQHQKRDQRMNWTYDTTPFLAPAFSKFGLWSTRSSSLPVASLALGGGGQGVTKNCEPNSVQHLSHISEDTKYINQTEFFYIDDK